MRSALLAILIALACACDGVTRERAADLDVVVAVESTTLPARVGPTARQSPGPSVVLGVEAQTLYQRSLVRDPAPSCAELTHGLAAPVAALLEVAERVVAPPSSAMRAATCLLREHAAVIEPQMLRWVDDPGTMGLGLLALNHLDDFEPALAERVVAAALAGKYANTARLRVQRSASRIRR